jgi:acetyltransferase-like isoleucine patch superfamily enzyme
MKNLFKRLYIKFASPNKVAKFLGVCYGENCNFGTKSFGSEPYLIEVGNNFYSSSSVQFITHDGSVNVLRNIYKEYKNIDLILPIKIGNNVFLGYGCIVLPGTIIEDNVIVGAGSIIKGNLKENSVYAGTLAKYICSLDKYVEKNHKLFMQTKNMSMPKKEIYIKKIFNDIVNIPSGEK